MKKLKFSVFLAIVLILTLTMAAFAVPPKPGVQPPVNEKGIPLYLSLDEPRDISAKLAADGGWFGDAKVLVIMMEFADFGFPAEYGQAYWNELLQGENNASSMQKFYERISYNQFHISFGFSPVVKVSEPLEFYGSDSGASHDVNVKQAITEALDILSGQGFAFSDYDVDADGALDHVIFIQAGPDQAGGAPVWAIWSHRSSFGYDIPDSDVDLDGYTIQPIDGEVGVFSHEFGHDLGLPDLYDRDYSSSGAGNWALMGGGSWNGDGKSPSEMIAFHRNKLGWLDFTVITEDQAGLEIPNLEDNAYAALLWTDGTPGTEYFLLENRQPVYSDAALPAHGLLIWHIQEANELTQNDLEFNYYVALEQADALYDLELNINGGDAGDPFPGAANNRSFTANTNPSSRSILGVNTFVEVNNISDSKTTMTADVKVNPATAPDATQVLSPLGAQDSKYLTFNWASVTGASSYVFEVAADKEFTQILSKDEFTTTSVSLALDYGTSYFWRVKPKNLAGEGPYTGAAAFSTPAVADTVLVIDDGGGFGIAPYYQAALRANGVYYNAISLFEVSGASLNNFLFNELPTYKNIIWAGDYGYMMYIGIVQDILAACADQGSNLFVTGQDNGWATDYGYISTTLTEDILHAGYVQDDIGIWTLTGTAGSTFDGMEIDIFGGTGANNVDYPDEFDPLGTAVALFTYKPDTAPAVNVVQSQSTRFVEEVLPLKGNDLSLLAALSTGTGAVYYDSAADANYVGTADYKAVTFGFGLEAISTADLRAAVMKKVLQLFAADDVAAPVVSNAAASNFEPGTPVSVNFTLDQAASVSAVVYAADQAPQAVGGMQLLADENVIATILTSKAYPAGPVTVQWNGLDDNGNQVAAGDYVVAVVAEDVMGNSAGVTSIPFAVNGTADIMVMAVDRSVLTPNGDNVADVLNFNYTLTENALVQIELLDKVSGDLVGTLLNNEFAAGQETHQWDGAIENDVVADGSYLIRVTATGQSGVDIFEAALAVDANKPEIASFISSPFISPSNPAWRVNSAGNVPVGKVTFQISEQSLVSVEYYTGSGDNENVYYSVQGFAPAGWVTVEWDATDMEGNLVPDGVYNIRVTATDAANNSVVYNNTSVVVDTIPAEMLNVAVTPAVVRRYADGVEDNVALHFETNEELTIAYMTLRLGYDDASHGFGSTVLTNLEGDTLPMAAGEHDFTIQWRDGEDELPVGSYAFRLRMYDNHSTNKIYVYPFSIVDYTTVNAEGANLGAGFATVSIPADALSKETKIVAYRDYSEFYVQKAYLADRVQALGSLVIESDTPALTFKKPVTLTYSYADSMMFDTNLDGIDEEAFANANFTICRWDGSSLTLLPTTKDAEAGTITAETNRVGTFTVLVAEESDAYVGGDQVKVGVLNNPFSPNGDGKKDSAFFKFYIPTTAEVTLSIYDHNGNLARTILNKAILGSALNSVEWDGTNDGGQVLPSGIYIYKYSVTVGGKTTTGQSLIGILK